MARFVRPQGDYPTAFIYALTNPAEPYTFAYAGQSSVPARRYTKHTYHNAPTDAPGIIALHAWIGRILSTSHRPQMVILEAAPAADDPRAKARWIPQAAREGHPLLNGGGPCPPST